MERKFDVCQKCGNKFTTEHPLAWYCDECRIKKLKRTDLPHGVREEKLSKDKYEIRFLDYYIAAFCDICNREIDITPKYQPHEMKCPGCGRTYSYDVVVKQYTPY